MCCHSHHGPEAIFVLHLHAVALVLQIDPLVVAVIILHTVTTLAAMVFGDRAAVPAILQGRKEKDDRNL